MALNPTAGLGSGLPGRGPIKKMLKVHAQSNCGALGLTVEPVMPCLLVSHRQAGATETTIVPRNEKPDLPACLAGVVWYGSKFADIVRRGTSSVPESVARGRSLYIGTPEDLKLEQGSFHRSRGN